MGRRKGEKEPREVVVSVRAAGGREEGLDVGKVVDGRDVLQGPGRHDDAFNN